MHDSFHQSFGSLITCIDADWLLTKQVKLDCASKEVRDQIRSRRMVQSSILSLLLSKFVSIAIPHLFQGNTSKSRRPDSRRLRACAEAPKQAGDPGSKLAVSSALCFKASESCWEAWLPHYRALHSAVVSADMVICWDFTCTLTREHASIYLVLP